MAVIQSIISPEIIGREPILNDFYRLAGEVNQGKGRLALITGEAGMGKTRLLSTVKRDLVNRGWRVLEGRCYERDQVIPFAPLSDLLRSYLNSSSTQERDQELSGPAVELVKLVPEMESSFANPAPLPPLEPEQEKRRLFEVLTNFIVRLSTNQRLMVIIEDLHWSDDTSLEFLPHLVRWLTNQPVFLVVNFRHEEVQGSLRHFLAQLDRERIATEFALDPLSKQEVGAMLEMIFTLKRPVRAEFLDTIYSLTEGNPFYVEEILKSLVTAGSIMIGDPNWDRNPMQDLRIPRSIQDAVQGRLDHLSPVARQVALSAAVVGQRFDFNLLLDLIGISETQLLAVIKELTAAQLVVEASAEHFTFRHALTRESIYTSLLRRERKQNHHAIAMSMKRLYSGSREERIDDLVYHFFRAEDWDKALVYARRAGERAQSLYAAREAIVHFTRTIEAASHLGPAIPAELFLARGWALDTVGDFEAAQQDYLSAHQSAIQVQDGESDWRSLIGLGSLWASRDYDRTGTYFKQALDLARSIGDPRLVAHSLNRVGNWQVNIGQPSEACSQHQEALIIFESLASSSSGMPETFDLLGMANTLAGNLVEGFACLQKAIEGFQILGDRQSLVSSLTSQIICSPTYQTNTLVASLRLNEAVHAGEQAQTIAHEIGHRAAEAYAYWMLGACLGPAGDYGKAFTSASAGLAIAEEIEHTQWRSAAHFVLGALNLDVFALSEAQDHLEQSLAIANQMGARFWRGNATAYLALVYIRQGRLALARSLLEEIVNKEALSAGLVTTSSQRLIQAARAELFLAEGSPEAALQIIEALLTSAVNVTTGRQIPRLLHLRAQAFHAIKWNQAARDDLEAALLSARELGNRAEAWRIEAASARLYIELDDDLKAQSEQENAEQILQELAASLDVSHRKSFLEQAMKQLPGNQKSGLALRSGSSELTVREKEVARYIGFGKSSREIAELLVLSPRTIETHVGNILSKLSFQSRAQIAIWAAEHNLLDSPKTD